MNVDSEGSTRQFKNIDEYIAMFPENVQHKLKEIKSAIKESAPEAEEAISYGMPAFKLNGILVWFAAYKKHIGFYPTHSGILAFEENLSAYKHSKGAVQFPIDGPIPLDIVREIVRFRVKENLARGVRRREKN
ncbi:MAG: iron chaperone [Ktedonobacteraceae bacterium]